MKVIEVRVPAPDGSVFSKEAADKMKGQYLHVLFNGDAWLAQVQTATLYDQGASVYLACEVQVPEEEPVPEPIELTTEEAVFALEYERGGSDLADDDCLRMAPEAECPAAGSPRCLECVWRPADG